MCNTYSFYFYLCTKLERLCYTFMSSLSAHSHFHHVGLPYDIIFNWVEIKNLWSSRSEPVDKIMSHCGPGDVTLWTCWQRLCHTVDIGTSHFGKMLTKDCATLWTWWRHTVNLQWRYTVDLVSSNCGSGDVILWNWWRHTVDLVNVN